MCDMCVEKRGFSTEKTKSKAVPSAARSQSTSEANNGNTRSSCSVVKIVHYDYFLFYI